MLISFQEVINMLQLKSGICPVCHSKLQVSKLSCPTCNAEFPIKEPISPFDVLNSDQTDFLILFLKCRGNLKALGTTLNLSYPTVKKRFDDILATLGYSELTTKKSEVYIDMSVYEKMTTDLSKPSDIIRSKIYENGGIVTVRLYDGNACKIFAENDGKSFSSDKLGSARYTYDAFDVIVDHLKASPGYRAPKGTARNKADKVGYGKCVEGTVIYNFATKYAGKAMGASTFDPIFVLAAVLEWAGIIHNGRGFLELNTAYRDL